MLTVGANPDKRHELCDARASHRSTTSLAGFVLPFDPAAADVEFGAAARAADAASDSAASTEPRGRSESPPITNHA